jgi:Tol biopolymer transport system component/DNA-binding winged helix-turn-helix (wHTH) protein
VQTSILYFDQFELDLNSYELRKSGRVIKLEKLPMELLILLAESHGQLVTREQIIQRLWGDNVYVDTRQGINTAMRKLRIALQDDSENPRLLQTVSGRGYRLLAVVSSPAAAGGQTVEPAVVPPPPSPYEPALPGESALANAVSKPKNRRHTMAIAGALVALLAIGGLVAWLYYRNQKNSASRKAWIKITNFSDSATQPALSPDGHMIAFIRGPETFVTPGEIYVKILPDGEPVQLTHDGLPKMAPAFSPDGSRIAYTATDRSVAWNSWVVPVLGGESKELLPNAAALTWLDREHVMFSEGSLRTAAAVTPMGIASAMESRAEERGIYLPPGGMAHRSWVSPDRKWVLVSEMDSKGWGPCRVIPFDGSTMGELVGPKPARCTYAAWSPDGATMYFSADAGDGYHTWRQAFPRGSLEQITFGPTEEEGIAVVPDGGSLVTSAGIRESTVWVHDARGDRQISGEGFATVPGLGFGGGEHVRSVFSPDGKKLYYLIRRQASRSWVSGELWAADLDSGRSEPVLPGVSITSNFSISPDGKRVVFEATDASGEPHAWIAPLDRSSPPSQITGSIARSPDFGAGGRIYFQAQAPDGEDVFLYSVELDGGTPQKVSEPLPRLMGLLGVSPRGEWRLSGITPAIVQPVGGGTPIRICKFCSAGWGPEGKYFYLRFRDIGEQGGGKTIVLTLPEGKELPDLPPGGLKSAEDAKGLKVLAEIDMNGRAIFVPGPNPFVYAYTRVTVQRNIYRIPLD